MTIGRGCSILLLSFAVTFVLLFSQSSAGVSPNQRGLQRGLQTHNNQEIIRGELIHRDHPRSPLCHPNATQFDRIATAIRRSLHRENQISSNRRQLAFSTPIDAAGNSLPGEYVMEIFLGTPQQKFVAIVDTGSDLLWVQCAPCIVCFKQPDALFYPANSSSYEAVPCTDPLCDTAVTQLPGISCDSTCHFEYNYLDNSSIAGYLSKETLYLTNTTGTVTGPGFSPFLFGCMNNDTGLFTNVDGLVGFGMGPMSLPSQISGVERATFSYCLVSISAAPNFTSSLFFGTTTASVNGLPLVYTPLVQNTYAPSFYFASMTGISVNGVDLGIPLANFQFDPAPASTGGVLFDSGTVLTLLRTGIIEYVLTALQAAVTTATRVAAVDTLQLCYQLTAPPPDVTMSFFFQGVDGTTSVEYALDPYNIWINADSGVWCAAIRASADQSLIGNIAQANHFIETDIVGKTIGWLSVDCLASF